LTIKPACRAKITFTGYLKICGGINIDISMVLLGTLSIVVGFLGALTGLGGASMLVPVLVVLGVPVKVAIASSMISIIATSGGAASAYIRERITNIKIAMFLEVFTITGAIIGATITTFIAPVLLYFFFAAFLLTSFSRVTQFAQDYVPAAHSQDKISQVLDLQGSYFDEAREQVIEYRATNSLLGGMGMVVAGLAAGMLGIGAGAFKVTVQEHILKLPPKVSSTTSNFIIGMTALAATSVYLFSGFLNLTLMAPIALGTTIGALFGARVLNKLNDKIVRVLFYIIVAMLIIQMLYKGITAL
jgi:uncharacterized membrane protein YfcA